MNAYTILLFAVVGCVFLGATNGFLLQQECKFTNYKVYNVHLKNAEQMKLFKTLRQKYPVYIMKEGSENGVPFYLSMEPKLQKTFESTLANLNIHFELVNEDLQKLIDARNRPSNVSNLTSEMNWTEYHHLRTIERWMAKIARKYSFVKKRLIGFSYWKRPIYALEVSKNPGQKAIVMMSNIHAIEWISSAVSTCFLDRLLKSDGSGDIFDQLLNNYDWLIVPIQNPDGFWFTHNKCPLWRKTRSFYGAFNKTGLCYGVDANRNYDSYWGESGYNLNDPCDHFYAGKKAESEPEVRASVNYFKSFNKNGWGVESNDRYIRMMLHLHSYGQFVLEPYGHSLDVVPSNFEQIKTISSAFSKAAESRHGKKYLRGSSGQLLGFVSGSAKDYFYDQGVPYSVTIELRDRGQFGFFLPPEQILDTCDEFSYGVAAMVEAGEGTGLFN